MNQAEATTPRYDYTAPRLVDYDGDLSKEWFFIYYIWHLEKGEKVRKRVSVSGATAALRYTNAKRDMKEIERLLRAGATVGKVKVPKAPAKLDATLTSIPEGILFAMSKKKTRIRGTTMENYDSFHRIFSAWLENREYTHLKLKDLNADLVFEFFDYLKEVRQIANKTYNNYHTNFSALMTVLVKRNVLPENPCDCIEKLKVSSSGHTPYSGVQMKTIKQELLSQGDHQMLLFISFCYYTAGRPHTEITTLRVSHLWEKTILITGDNAKNHKAEHVIIPAPLEELLQQYKIRENPPSWFIFGKDGKPGPERVGQNLFYKKQRRLLNKLGLTYGAYDVYGFKHTAVIDLYNAGVDIKDIQRHCRHSSITQTDKYLRDLGLIKNDELAAKYPRF